MNWNYGYLLKAEAEQQKSDRLDWMSHKFCPLAQGLCRGDCICRVEIELIQLTETSDDIPSRLRDKPNEYKNYYKVMGGYCDYQWNND